MTTTLNDFKAKSDARLYLHTAEAGLQLHNLHPDLPQCFSGSAPR